VVGIDVAEEPAASIFKVFSRPVSGGIPIFQ
jgi:hypothetical protein